MSFVYDAAMFERPRNLGMEYSIRQCVLCLFIVVAAASAVHSATGEVPAVERLFFPSYPVIAAKARIQGEVRLELLIGTDGVVESVDVMKGLPLGLAESATEALLNWRFQVEKNTPQASGLVEVGAPKKVAITVEFHLQHPLQTRGFVEMPAWFEAPDRVHVVAPLLFAKEHCYHCAVSSEAPEDSLVLPGLNQPEVTYATRMVRETAPEGSGKPIVVVHQLVRSSHQNRRQVSVLYTYGVGENRSRSHLQYLLYFESLDWNLAVTPERLVVGSAGFRMFDALELKGDSIRLSGSAWMAGDAVCCPSGSVETEIAMVSGRLVEWQSTAKLRSQPVN